MGEQIPDRDPETGWGEKLQDLFQEDRVRVANYAKRGRSTRTFQSEGFWAAFVVAGIGSLDKAHLRRAGAEEVDVLEGKLELLTLSGSIAANGAHLHAAIATASGEVVGGHLAYGCTVRTTAEVLLGLLPEWSFMREPDLGTGYAELSIRPRQPGS